VDSKIPSFPKKHEEHELGWSLAMSKCGWNNSNRPVACYTTLAEQTLEFQSWLGV